ncbi:hypothetical protein BJV82DRAFT_580947 [Fennellomyces sp. T-0311]|nr:hypothetical protein BJV82DRAFT_580947 [Fennellomyces sp. T-0311]
MSKQLQSPNRKRNIPDAQAPAALKIPHETALVGSIVSQPSASSSAALSTVSQVSFSPPTILPKPAILTSTKHRSAPASSHSTAYIHNTVMSPVILNSSSLRQITATPSSSGTFMPTIPRSESLVAGLPKRGKVCIYFDLYKSLD